MSSDTSDWDMSPITLEYRSWQKEQEFRLWRLYHHRYFMDRTFVTAHLMANLFFECYVARLVDEPLTWSSGLYTFTVCLQFLLQSWLPRNAYLRHRGIIIATVRFLHTFAAMKGMAVWSPVKEPVGNLGAAVRHIIVTSGVVLHNWMTIGGVPLLFQYDAWLLLCLGPMLSVALHAPVQTAFAGSTTSISYLKPLCSVLATHADRTLPLRAALVKLLRLQYVLPGAVPSPRLFAISNTQQTSFPAMAAWHLLGGWLFPEAIVYTNERRMRMQFAKRHADAQQDAPADAHWQPRMQGGLLHAAAALAGLAVMLQASFVLHLMAYDIGCTLHDRYGDVLAWMTQPHQQYVAAHPQ